MATTGLTIDLRNYDGFRQGIKGLKDLLRDVKQVLDSSKTSYNTFEQFIAGINQDVPVIRRELNLLSSDVGKLSSSLANAGKSGGASFTRALRDSLEGDDFATTITRSMDLSDEMGEAGREASVTWKRGFERALSSGEARALGQEVERSFKQGTDEFDTIGSDTAREFARGFERQIDRENFKQQGDKVGDDFHRGMSSGLDLSLGTITKFAGAAAGIFAAIQIGDLAKDAFSFSLNSFIEYEDQFADLRKTITGTPEELESISRAIRDMATDLDAPTAGLENAHAIMMGIAADAGQLGVKTEDIVAFTEAMGQLYIAAPDLQQEGASMLAQFLNIFQSDVGAIATPISAALVDLGNKLAATENDILRMGTRLAGAGRLAGLTEQEVMGLAGAMASVGIEAEAGGSAMSTIIKKMVESIYDGSAEGQEALEGWAAASGLSIDDFSDMIQTRPAEAITAFITNFGELEKGTQLAFLEGLGLDALRTSDTILRLSGNAQLLADSFNIANSAFAEAADPMSTNNALLREAENKFDTTRAKINLFWNVLRDGAIDVGAVLSPFFNAALDEAIDLAEGIGGVVTAAQPLFDLAAEALGIDISTGSAAEIEGVNAALVNQNALLLDLQEATTTIPAQIIPIEAGDTLWEISEATGVAIDKLLELNAMNPDVGGLRMQDEYADPTNPDNWTVWDKTMLRTGGELIISEEQVGVPVLDPSLVGAINQNLQSAFDEAAATVEPPAAEETDNPLKKMFEEAFSFLDDPAIQAVVTNAQELFDTINNLELGEKVKPEDVETLKTLFDIFVQPQLAAGIGAVNIGLMTLSVAVDALDDSLELILGLGEAFIGLTTGDTEKVGRGLERAANGFAGLADAVIVGSGVQIADEIDAVLGMEVDEKDPFAGWKAAFELLPIIIDQTINLTELKLAQLRLTAANALNDIIDTFNQAAPDVAGLDIDKIDTSDLEAAVASRESDMAGYAIGVPIEAYLAGDIDLSTFSESLTPENINQAITLIQERIAVSAEDDALSLDIALNVAENALEGLTNQLSSTQQTIEVPVSISAGLQEDIDLFATLQSAGETDKGLLTNIISQSVGEGVSVSQLSQMLDDMGFGTALAQALALQGESIEGVNLSDVFEFEGVDPATLSEDIKSSLSPETLGVLENAFAIGESIQDGISQGLDEDTAAQAALDMAMGITDTINGTLEIQSPSQVAYRQGVAFDEGLALGILEGSGLVQEALLLNSLFVQQFATGVDQAMMTAQQGYMRGGAGAQAGAIVFAGANQMMATSALNAAGAIAQVLNQLNMYISALSVFNAMGGMNAISTIANAAPGAIESMAAAGAKPMAQGGRFEQGGFYEVAEPSIGGVELMRDSATGRLFMIANTNGELYPPNPANFSQGGSVTQTSSSSVVFAPTITIGANAGVTAAEVEQIVMDVAQMMVDAQEPAALTLRRQGL